MNIRSKKTIEIKTNFLKNNITETVYPELIQFYTILNDWHITGKKYTGIINIPKLKKDIIYQLDKPNLTVVKLSLENDNVINIKNPFVNTNKIGRNDPCNCGSNIKYKKCCFIFS